MKTNKNAELVFKKTVKGSNFITPHIIGFYGDEKYAIELSEGTGFDNKELYGVTVVKDAIHYNPDCTLCFSLKEAMFHIEKLITKNKKA